MSEQERFGYEDELLKNQNPEPREEQPAPEEGFLANQRPVHREKRPRPKMTRGQKIAGGLLLAGVLLGGADSNTGNKKSVPNAKPIAEKSLDQSEKIPGAKSKHKMHKSSLEIK